MQHHRPYQGGLIEKAGLEKCKDLYAWRYTVGDVPTRARKAHDEVEAMPEVTARHVDMKNLDAELRTIMDVFNDAWSDNWAFVPFTERELSKMAADLKLIAIPELSYIAEIDGEPVAVALALPNINELIKDMNGKLGPMGLPKLLWRLKVVGPRTARLAILGIRKKLRNQRKYAALSVYLYTKMNAAGKRLGIEWGELSWTLEDNGPVNTAIKLMGGKVYNPNRIFEKRLRHLVCPRASQGAPRVLRDLARAQASRGDAWWRARSLLTAPSTLGRLSIFRISLRFPGKSASSRPTISVMMPCPGRSSIAIPSTTSSQPSTLRAMRRATDELCCRSPRCK
jgi:hypothetical protein